MASKRKAGAMGATLSDEPVDPSDELMFLALGGGNEVGRSCHIVQYKGKTVMVCLPPRRGFASESTNVSASSTLVSIQHMTDLLLCRSLTNLILAPSMCSSSHSKQDPHQLPLHMCMARSTHNKDFMLADAGISGVFGLCQNLLETDHVPSYLLFVAVRNSLHDIRNQPSIQDISSLPNCFPPCLS